MSATRVKLDAYTLFGAEVTDPEIRWHLRRVIEHAYAQVPEPPTRIDIAVELP